MPEIDTHFADLLDTLREARQVVEGELSSLSQASGLDRRALVVLDHSVRGFAIQADALVLMMAEKDAADENVEVAEELQAFFQRGRERIASLLTVGRE